MKRYFLIISLILCCSTPAYGYDINSAADKFLRGFLNISVAPLDIVKRIDLRTREKNIAVGLTVGTFEGTKNALYRAGAGIIELFTFPWNYPDPIKDPLVYPEYAWQEWDISYIDPADETWNKVRDSLIDEIGP